MSTDTTAHTPAGAGPGAGATAGTVPTAAKSEVLTRLHAALADSPLATEVPRAYRRSSKKSRAEVIAQLDDRLIDYKASVYHETPGTIAVRVRELLAPHGEGARYVVPAGLDKAWLPEDSALTRVVEPPVGRGGESAEDAASVSQPLTVTALDEIAAVVTCSSVSCSETGTIFLSGQANEGRRAITLVPDHHVCIVPEDSVVELIPEALERLTPTSPITMISGPSATSDIELERVEGVHGPRTLDVIILGS